jgi:hypothetical protein
VFLLSYFRACTTHAADDDKDNEKQNGSKQSEDQNWVLNVYSSFLTCHLNSDIDVSLRFFWFFAISFGTCAIVLVVIAV